MSIPETGVYMLLRTDKNFEHIFTNMKCISSFVNNLNILILIIRLMKLLAKYTTIYRHMVNLYESVGTTNYSI